MLKGVVARGPVHAMLFTPDSQTLYTVDGNGQVQAWSIPDMSSQQLFKHGHGNYACRLHLSLDGNSLLLGEGIPATGRYWCWDRSLGRLVYPGDTSKDPGGPFWFTSQIAAFPTFSAESRIYFVEMPGRLGIRYFPWPPIGESLPIGLPRPFQDQRIFSLLSDPSGRTLAVLLMNETILFWDRLNESSSSMIQSQFPAAGRAICHSFSGDGRLFAMTSPSGIRIYHTPTGQLLNVIQPSRPPNLLVFHPSGRYLAGGDSRAAILFWDVETGIELNQIYWKIGRIRSLAFSSDGLLCAAGGTLKKFVIWDVE